MKRRKRIIMLIMACMLLLGNTGTMGVFATESEEAQVSDDSNGTAISENGYRIYTPAIPMDTAYDESEIDQGILKIGWSSALVVALACRNEDAEGPGSEYWWVLGKNEHREKNVTWKAVLPDGSTAAPHHENDDGSAFFEIPLEMTGPMTVKAYVDGQVVAKRTITVVDKDIYGDPIRGWIYSFRKRYYIFPDGRLARGWRKLDGNWYYFNWRTGEMMTGWLKDAGKWYYLEESQYGDTYGVLKTGWVKYKNKWYYLKTDGSMKTGWLKCDNQWYYFNSNGSMKTGWLKVKNGDSDTWYYFNSNGTMRTGWLKYKKQWYYFGKDGVMVADGKYYIKDDNYYFGSDGAFLAEQKTADRYISALDESNKVDGFERVGCPKVMKRQWNWIYFPDEIYGIVYKKIVEDTERGVGGKVYYRIYRLDTGELYMEEFDLLK